MRSTCFQLTSCSVSLGVSRGLASSFFTLRCAVRAREPHTPSAYGEELAKLRALDVKEDLRDQEVIELRAKLTGAGYSPKEKKAAESGASEGFKENLNTQNNKSKNKVQRKEGQRNSEKLQLRLQGCELRTDDPRALNTVRLCVLNGRGVAGNAAISRSQRRTGGCFVCKQWHARTVLCTCCAGCYGLGTGRELL